MKTVRKKCSAYSLNDINKEKEWREGRKDDMLPRPLDDRRDGFDDHTWDASAKITVIQRDAPPDDEEPSPLVKIHHAVALSSDLNGSSITFFKEKDDLPLRIDSISEDGSFAKLGLAPNMTVLAINGRYMTWDTPENAMMELGRRGKIQVIVEDSPGKVYCKAHTMNIEADLKMQNWSGGPGILFSKNSDDSPLFVDNVQTDGPFSTLLPGMKIISINDRYMAWSTPELAYDALALSKNGKVKITVEAVLETINTKEHTIGLEMNEDEEVYITSVTSHCDRSVKYLKEGMQVLVLNGLVCLDTSWSGLEGILGDSGFMLDIIAVDLSEKKLDFIHDSTTKDPQKAGLVESQMKKLSAMERRLKEDGSHVLNYNTMQETISSALKRCTEPSVDQAVKIADRSSEVEADLDDLDDFSLPFADAWESDTAFKELVDKEVDPAKSFSIIKSASNEDIGLELVQGDNRGIYIAAIKQYSKFIHTGLAPGMRVSKINGIGCPGSMRVATAYINAISGTVELTTTYGKPASMPRREIFFSEY